MGLGMLFAGALTGGAKAVGELADDAIKQRERAEVRQQSIMDRRNELLFEMKAKADWAKREEEATAGAYARVAERGAQIGNERGARELEAARSMVPREGEFANDRITPEMLANMPPAARAIYEKEMGLTDDSTLQGLRDQVQASGELAAPSTVRKGILDSYKEEFKADKDEKDRKFRMEQEDRKDARNEANNNAREERTLMAINAAERRAAARGSGGSGGGDKPERDPTPAELKAALESAKKDAPKLDDYRGNAAKHEAAMKAWRESPDGKRAAELQSMYDRRFGLGTSPAAAPEKPAAQKSTVKDNPATASARPVEVKTKAAYDALPKGAKYVAPDGTVRTKG